MSDLRSKLTQPPPCDVCALLSKRSGTGKSDSQGGFYLSNLSMLFPNERARDAAYKAVSLRPEDVQDAITAAYEATHTTSECGCHTCSDLARRMSVMIVCPDCGNKRCPRATHHANACTNSNDPGQPGSIY